MFNIPGKFIVSIKKFKNKDLYVTEGQNPKKVFDLGDVNLEVEVEGMLTS